MDLSMAMDTTIIAEVDKVVARIDEVAILENNKRIIKELEEEIKIMMRRRQRN